MTSILKVSSIQDPQNSNTALSVDSSGIVTTPQRPAFHVIRQTSMSAAGDITYDTALFDIGSNFNLSTGEFTAPITGIYVFSFSCIGLNSSVATQIYGYLNGAERRDLWSTRPLAANRNEAFSSLTGASHILELSANDVWKLNANQALFSDSNSWVRFSGYLVG